MPRRSFVTCASIFFIVFLMCPKRIRPTASIDKQQEYFHAIKRSSNDVIDGQVEFGPDRWSNIVRQNEDEELQGVDNEPGFDLSDDEIRKFKLWPKGIIPYYIDVLSFNDKVLRDRIRLFLNSVNGLTRLSFLEMPSPPKDDMTRWVFFVNRRGQLGCSDHSVLNFTNEGVQHVNLGYDCISTGGELAEAVLSIVGVPAQHNSPDRDIHIKVVEENIMPDKRYLFHKLNDDHWLFHSIMYDFSSASHYHHHKYSINGRATVEFQNPDSVHTSIGENHGFSKSDVKKLRMLYNYIVKKKENKVPECDKLFKKGHNFVHDTVTFPEPKPRPKPKKYLGLPEEHHEEEHHDEMHHEENHPEENHPEENHPEENHPEENHPEDIHHDYEHHNEGHEKDNTEEGKCNAEDDDDTEEGSHDNDDQEPPPTRKMDLKSNPMKRKPKTYKYDPLTYLSDYETGDEHRRKSPRKNRTLKPMDKTSLT